MYLMTSPRSMKKYYDPTHKRLVFIDQEANPDFWDDQWKSNDLRQRIEQDSKNRYLVNLTRRFLKPNKATRILEGGCGFGPVVLSLQRAGYNAYGIDYAKQTIRNVKEIYPSLNVSFGDVQDVPFADNYFDGYWSLGVIEHYYDGYHKILEEMKRVVRPGGFIFLTFPHFSLLRRTKSALGLYPVWNNNNPQKSNFYQFALSQSQVSKDFRAMNSKLLFRRAADGIKGLKEEIPMVQPGIRLLQRIPSPAGAIIRAGISESLAPICGHISINVWQVRK